jgi:hypothetical protein
MIAEENVICDGCQRMIRAGQRFEFLIIKRTKFGRRTSQSRKFCSGKCRDDLQFIINEMEASGHKPTPMPVFWRGQS